MSTYGPFYPSTIAAPGWTDPDGAKQPGGQSASFTIVGEGGTPLLTATNFSASIPDGSIKSVRFVLPQGVITGRFNPDVKDMVSVGAPVDLSQNGDSLVAEDNLAPTMEQVESTAFGLSLSIYAGSGGTVSIDSIALYVETE